MQSGNDVLGQFNVETLFVSLKALHFYFLISVDAMNTKNVISPHCLDAYTCIISVYGMVYYTNSNFSCCTKYFHLWLI